MNIKSLGTNLDELKLSDSGHPSDSTENVFVTQVTSIRSPRNCGEVFLVGAGPGDPDLLTVKALRLLQSADVVLYDALISQEILDRVNHNAQLIHVGKRANKHFVSQTKTNQLLVKFAKLGQQVVRLKGGDPFIFGRGGEELQALKAHQIPFQVVPGITAASGCTSYAGIPLTHRDFAQSVRLVTAHQKENSKVNWKGLAEPNQTLVFYMGLMKNKLISKALIEHGVLPSMPVAIIENGTCHNQRVVTGELVDLVELVIDNNLRSPALIVVGEVVNLAEQLCWFQNESWAAENFTAASSQFGVA